MLTWMLAACTKAAPEPPAQPPAPPPPEVTVDEPPPVDSPVVATWTSEPCGDRAYPRELTFAPDFTYSGRDLVSPCPPEATCIWDGIVEFRGTWSDEGTMVVLVETEVMDDGKGATRPEHLRRSQSGHLIEAIGEGETCGYARSD